jgi:hypothetical protein
VEGDPSAATAPGQNRTQLEFNLLRSSKLGLSKLRTRTRQDAPEKPLAPLHGGRQGFESPRLRSRNVRASSPEASEELSLNLFHEVELLITIMTVGKWAHLRHEKGNLVVRRARKAVDLREEAARLPNGKHAAQKDATTDLAHASPP